MKSHLLKTPVAILTNFFIPQKDFSVEEKGKRKLFISFLSILSISLASFVIYHFIVGNNLFGYVNLTMLTFQLSMIFILRKLKEGKNLFRITMIMITLILSFWGLKGAIDGYASLFALSFPLLAFFLMGRKEGFLWTLLLFSIYLTALINPFNIYFIYNYPSNFTLRYIVTFIFIVLFSYNYESVRQNYKEAINKEQKKLLDEKNLLKEVVNSLNLENKIRIKTQNELEVHKNNLEELITERTNELQKSRDELLDSEKRYRILAENLNDLIWSADKDMNFTYISPSIETMFGYTVDEARKLTHKNWYDTESFEKITSAFNEVLDTQNNINETDNHFVILELNQIKKDGSFFPTEVKISSFKDNTNNTYGIIGITRDITKRRKAEDDKALIQAQLSQAQKMEAVGTLVGGLAHDFNNIIVGIIGSFNLIELLIKDETFRNKNEIEDYIQVGLDSSQRSSHLIKQLLTFSQKHELLLESIDLNNSLNHILSICQNSLPKSVLLDFKIEDKPLYVMAEPYQIEQVLLNLCINASHAMTIMRPHNSDQGGTLTVSTSIINKDNLNYEIPSQSNKYNKWVSIDVFDTGIGMDDNTLKRLFDPFFTTKTQDQGTGLGLATSYSIIKQHNGFIKVSSELTKGSKFSIFLPYGIEVFQNFDNEKSKTLVPGHGTILVIDDEEFILKIASGILSQCGYKTITAKRPEEGIEIYREQHDSISAVLLDLSMPGKSGFEVYKKLEEINPNVRALLSSGMIDIEGKKKALKMGIKKVIHKPYIASELSDAIKKATQ